MSLALWNANEQTKKGERETLGDSYLTLNLSLLCNKGFVG